MTDPNEATVEESTGVSRVLSRSPRGGCVKYALTLTRGRGEELSISKGRILRNCGPALIRLLKG
ncbi:hypothetical protein [Nocardia salmonicida]|uniref:hypothetical protein n=1 Tax=Nocardia salmonicida TaxID=53431 RepID=UPI00378CA8E9